jgi:Zn-finger nucleic acid-binding protein
MFSRSGDTLLKSMQCPCCEGALRSLCVGGETLEECTHCGGEFCGQAALSRILSAHALGEGSDGTAYQRPSPFSDPVRYRKCPACGDMMQRQNFRESSGVVVDVCSAHGIWLDRGELATLIEFAASGALADAERRIRERADARK